MESKYLNRKKRILDQKSYWIEKLNSSLYNAIVNYKEQNNLKQKDLAELFDVSKGRVSQILNTGDINFSMEKIVDISLKIGVYPDFNFESKEDYFEREITSYNMKTLPYLYYEDNNQEDTTISTPKGKVVRLKSCESDFNSIDIPLFN